MATQIPFLVLSDAAIWRMPYGMPHAPVHLMRSCVLFLHLALQAYLLQAHLTGKPVAGEMCLVLCVVDVHMSYVPRAALLACYCCLRHDGASIYCLAQHSGISMCVPLALSTECICHRWHSQQIFMSITPYMPMQCSL